MNKKITITLLVAIFSLFIIGFGLFTGPTAQAEGPDKMTDSAYLAANPDLIELDRNYGTFSGLWTGYIDRVATANPDLIELDRNYGTFSGLWTGYIDHIATANPDLIELDRNYGTFSGLWTGYIE